MKLELLKLTPFYASQIIYWWIAYIPATQPGLWTAFIKCLPVSSLACYLATSGSSCPQVQALALGMMASVGGDFCLVYSDLFAYGIVCFALAHCCFLKAYGGLWPLKPV